MPRDTYFFDRSGQIIRQPDVTEDQIHDFLQTARRIADTSDATRSADVLLAVTSAFLASAENNSMRSDADCDWLRSIHDEAAQYRTEACWSALIARTFGASANRAISGP